MILTVLSLLEALKRHGLSDIVSFERLLRSGYPFPPVISSETVPIHILGAPSCIFEFLRVKANLSKFRVSQFMRCELWSNELASP